jgi:hypothetical protein
MAAQAEAEARAKEEEARRMREREEEEAGQAEMDRLEADLISSLSAFDGTNLLSVLRLLSDPLRACVSACVRACSDDQLSVVMIPTRDNRHISSRVDQ